MSSDVSTSIDASAYRTPEWNSMQNSTDFDISKRVDGEPPSTSGSGPMSGLGRGGASSPADGQKTYACYGLTMFSQHMLENKNLPTCTGWRSKPEPPPDLRGAAVETAPASNFKYMCVGVCAYEEAQLRASHAELLRNPTTPIALPYCEGLEVVSSTDPVVVPAPAMLPEGGLDAAAGTAPIVAAEKPKQPRPRFATPPSGISGDPIDFAAFSDRVFKTAGKIVRQMGLNLALMRDTVKKATGIDKS